MTHQGQHDGLIPEVGQYKVRGREYTFTMGQGCTYAGLPERDDSREAALSQAGDESGMPVDLPSLLNAEGGSCGLRGLERAVAVAQRDFYPGITEAYNVRVAAGSRHGKKSGMQRHLPSLLHAEPWINRQCGLKRAIAIA